MGTRIKAAVCAATVAFAFTSAASTAGRAAATVAGPEDCVPFQTDDVTYVDARGATARTWAPGDGLVATYSAPDGLTRRARILPAGLDGDTAPAAVLTALHVPAGEGADRAALLRSMHGPARADLKPDVPAMCQTSRVNTSYSTNWSGRVVTTYSNSTDVSGTFIVPTYYSACAHSSAHSTWVGFGGWYSNSAGLIQAGIDTSQSSVNAAYAFYEVWPRQAEVKVSSPSVRAGQRLEVLVGYFGSGDSGFSFYNTSTGASVSYDEYSTASYVDGRSAEWIDERPSKSRLSNPVDGSFYYYRKSSNVGWSSEEIRGSGVGSLGSAVYMRRPNGTILGTAALGSSASTHYWKACA